MLALSEFICTGSSRCTSTGTTKIESANYVISKFIQKWVISIHISDSLVILHPPVGLLILLLQSFYFFDGVLIFSLDVLQFRQGVFLSCKKIALFLIPFGSVGFMGENQLSLLGVSVLGLLLQVIILLLEELLFSFILSLQVFNLLLTICLVQLIVLLYSIPFLDNLFDSFLEATLF